MKMAFALSILIAVLFFTACSGVPAPEKTDVLAGSGTFAYEFPDSFFRRDVLHLLNDHDGANRSDSSVISPEDYSFMASIEKLDVSTRSHGTFAALMGIWRPQYYYGKSQGKDNLKGIEYFTALKELNCCFNRITELDLSKNTKLVNLNCNDNKLTGLDLTNNPALEILLCHRNYISALDLTKNTVLRELGCDTNRIAKFDLSKNTLLRVLSCYDNKLTSLDLSKNTLLEVLTCTMNFMKSTDDVIGLANGATMDFDTQWPGDDDYYSTLLAEDAKKY